MKLKKCIFQISGAIFEVNWRLVAGLTGILPIVSCILVLIFLPESPVWLLSKGKTEAAKISLSKLRGVPANESLPQEVQNEFHLIEEIVSLKGKHLENEKETFLQMAKSPEVELSTKYEAKSNRYLYLVAFIHNFWTKRNTLVLIILVKFLLTVVIFFLT